MIKNFTILNTLCLQSILIVWLILEFVKVEGDYVSQIILNSSLSLKVHNFANKNCHGEINWIRSSPQRELS